MPSSLSQNEQLFIKECTNQNCEFQGGCKVFEDTEKPAPCTEQCTYCGSLMKWFSVSMDEDTLEEEVVDER